MTHLPRLGYGAARVFEPGHFVVGETAVGGLNAVAGDQLFESYERLSAWRRIFERAGAKDYLQARASPD